MRRPTFLQTYQKTLRTRPLIVGTIAGPYPLKAQIQSARAARPDIVEIRLDTLPLQAFQEIHSKITSPLLLTIRSAHENGGKKPLRGVSEANRLTLFQFLIPLCDMIDVELRHASLIKELTPLARRFNVDVMHSTHDFKGIGTRQRLEKLAKQSRVLKGDVFKAAVMPKNELEMESFLGWGLELTHPCPVFIGMGVSGQLSRFAGYSFGSKFAYGHLGHPAAPGQPSVAELKKQIHRIYREAERN